MASKAIQGTTAFRHKRLSRSTPFATDGTHLAILQMGVAIWNRWRVKDPLTTPVLTNADLSGLDLENINLCRADLRGANLSGCYLYDADFQGANLRRANLCRAGLIGANFHRANLSGADLSHAYLAQSDLSNANLSSARLQEADLQAALLTEATFNRTQIAKAEMTDCFDLTVAQLAVAQDAHLAFCTDSLTVGLPTDAPVDELTGLMPKAVDGAGGGAKRLAPMAISLVFSPETLASVLPTPLLKAPAVSQPTTLRRWIEAIA